MLFISYASADVTAAEQLESWLEKAGYKCWRDRLILRAGDRWRLEIKKAIEESAAFIVLLSDKYAESENCEDESNYARHRNKRIIPIRLKSNVQLFEFSSRNVIDFNEQEVLSACASLHLNRREHDVIVNPLAERLLEKDLVALIDAYEETERNLTQQLVGRFCRYLESMGASSQGKLFSLSGRKYELTIGEDAFGRALHFVLLPLVGGIEKHNYSLKLLVLVVFTR